jgi:hypothetical protein
LSCCIQGETEFAAADVWLKSQSALRAGLLLLFYSSLVALHEFQVASEAAALERLDGTEADHD